MDAVIKMNNATPATTNRPAADSSAPASQTGKSEPESGKVLPPPPPVQTIEQAVKQINDYLVDHQRSLNFQLHEASGRTVIQVVNPETNEVVRQIPSEEVLDLAAEMRAKGLHLIDQMV